MSVYSPATSYSVDYPIGSVAISIPSRRQISWTLAAWTLMWLIVIPVIGYLLIANLNTAKGLNLIVVLILLASIVIRIYPALYLLAWQIAGHETLEVSPEAIVVRSRVLVFNRRREYAAEYLSGVKAALPDFRRFSFLRFDLAPFEVQSGGPIELIYKGKSMRVGRSLTYEDGLAIVATIHQRLPQFRPVVRTR